MTIEDRALAAFKEANLVPDPDSLDSARLAGYLAVIEQRSSGMTKTDQETIEAKPPRNRRPIAGLVAAAAVIAGVIGIGALLANTESESDVVDTPPTPTVAETTPPPTEAEAEVEALEVTPETIVGYWGRYPLGVMAIHADGTLRMAAVPRGTSVEDMDGIMEESGLYAGGAWELLRATPSGDVLAFTADGTGQYCEAGAVASMTLAFQGEKLVISNVVDSPCFPNEAFGAGRFPGIWERAS